MTSLRDARKEKTNGNFFKFFARNLKLNRLGLIAPMEPGDHEMYRAAIHGDTEAFEMVVRKMSRPLFAIAFGALQNREEAEDVVQDAFVKAWKSRWQVRTPERLPPWIAMIVRHRAHDILMRRRNVPLEEQFNEINSIQAQFWRHRSVIALRYLEALRAILGRALAAMRKRLKTRTEVFS